MREYRRYDGISSPYFAPVELPWRALEGVRTRRILAFCLDFVLVSVLSMALWLVLLVLTVGLSVIVLPPLLPLVAVFYNGLTVSGPRMATPGMAALDLEMRRTDGTPVAFLDAAVHAVLFYVSTLFPPIFLVSLLSCDKRCLHDIFAAVIITRRAI
jgi:uncharacterized RDD family membrane protein YckC